MAIAHRATYNIPTTDNANESATTVTFTPSGEASGDVVLVWLLTNQTDGTWSNTTSGGQTWTNVGGSGNGTSRLFTCIFNGTWSANPVFTYSGSSGPVPSWMVSFTGVDSTIWDVSPTFEARASGNSTTIATFNTNTNGAWALIGGGNLDNGVTSLDNSFVLPSGGAIAGWRSSGGTDAASILARKELATAGAVGDTIYSVTLGPDAKAVFWGALKPTAAAATPNKVVGADRRRDQQFAGSQLWVP